MKLIYLTADNLRNSSFVKELVYQYKHVGKSILLHDHFGSVADTRFVTKRISAMLSEELIVNNAFSGDLRNILTLQAGQIHLRKEILEEAFKTVSLVILNPLGIGAEGVEAFAAGAVAKVIRDAFPISEVHVFPKNLRSPLSVERRRIEDVAALAPLRAAYEEEALALEAAAELVPVVLASPVHFAPAGK
jgi:hypothetical protein